MFLETLKINSMHTAHNEATMPISATRLSPPKMLLKSRSVMLKAISARASTIRIVNKNFHCLEFLDV